MDESGVICPGTTAEDEYYLPRQLSKKCMRQELRFTVRIYYRKRDFVTIKSMGMEAVRIPVPYFIFGDREPFIGCIEELDKAFNWAEAYGLQILIDLHTVCLVRMDLTTEEFTDANGQSIRKRLNLSCLYWSVWQSVTGKEKGAYGELK